MLAKSSFCSIRVLSTPFGCAEILFFFNKVHFSELLRSTAIVAPKKCTKIMQFNLIKSAVLLK
jgi:hypothetical protein